jgi:hypothetical protein
MDYELVYKAALLTFAALFWLSLWFAFKLKVKPHRVERLPRKPRPEYVQNSSWTMG